MGNESNSSHHLSKITSMVLSRHRGFSTARQLTLVWLQLANVDLARKLS